VLEVKRTAYHDFRLRAGARSIVGIAPIGSTLAEPVFQVRTSDQRIVEAVPIAQLREAWDAPLRDFYGLSQGPGPSTSSGPSS
jgi:hypothetical protein